MLLLSLLLPLLLPLLMILLPLLPMPVVMLLLLLLLCEWCLWCTLLAPDGGDVRAGLCIDVAVACPFDSVQNGQALHLQRRQWVRAWDTSQNAEQASTLVSPGKLVAHETVVLTRPAVLFALLPFAATVPNSRVTTARQVILDAAAAGSIWLPPKRRSL